jgi:hypothetical protein
MNPKLSLLTVLFLLSACKTDDAYTLYRSSPILPDARIHIATFDAKDGANYNRDNCDLAKQLFSAQPGIITRFWCEKGKYKP